MASLRVCLCEDVEQEWLHIEVQSLVLKEELRHQTQTLAVHLEWKLHIVVCGMEWGQDKHGIKTHLPHTCTTTNLVFLSIHFKHGQPVFPVNLTPGGMSPGAD